MRRTFYLVMIMLATAFWLTGCSGEESIPEKASKKVDQITTDAADKVVKKIRTPINKAKLTKTMGDDRLEAIDQALENK